MSYILIKQKIKLLLYYCALTLVSSSLNANEIFDEKFGIVSIYLGEQLPSNMFPNDATSDNIPLYNGHFNGVTKTKTINNNTYTQSIQGGGMKLLMDMKEIDSNYLDFIQSKLFMYRYNTQSSKIDIDTTLSTRIVAEIRIQTNYEGTETFEECKKRAKAYALDFAKEEKYIDTIKNEPDEYGYCAHDYIINGKNKELARFSCRASMQEKKSLFNFLSKKSCEDIEKTSVNITFSSEILDKQYEDEIKESIHLRKKKAEIDEANKIKANNDSIHQMFN